MVHGVAGRGDGGGVKGRTARAAIRKGRQNGSIKGGLQHLTTFGSGKIAVRSLRR